MARLIRVIDIAGILGVSHQRASKIVDERGFPRPIGRQGQSRRWDRRDVTVWTKVWRKEKPWR